MFFGLLLVVLAMGVAQSLKVNANLNAHLKFSGKYQVLRIDVDNACYVRPLMLDEALCTIPIPTVQILNYSLQNLANNSLYAKVRNDLKDACGDLPMRLMLPAPTVHVDASASLGASVQTEDRTFGSLTSGSDAISSLIQSLFGSWFFDPMSPPAGK